jgi:hypothetical protein
MYWLSISNLLEPALKPLMISLTVSFAFSKNSIILSFVTPFLVPTPTVMGSGEWTTGMSSETFSLISVILTFKPV